MASQLSMDEQVEKLQRRITALEVEFRERLHSLEQEGACRNQQARKPTRTTIPLPPGANINNLTINA
jgi:hypothetical protein